jgi:hypothetical protein
VNGQVAGTPAATATELLTAVQFQEELRRVVRYRASPPIGDPLDAAVRRITQNPAFTQSRLLARVLTALTCQEGAFRRAELATFDSNTLAMVIALMDAHAAETSPPEDWIRAADDARAALAELS